MAKYALTLHLSNGSKIDAGTFEVQDGKSAYETAQDGGYTGSENDFNTKLAELMGYTYSAIIGEVDANNNIVITGELPDGIYTLKYEGEDGAYTEIGTLKIGNVITYTNLYDVSTMATSTYLNKRINSSGNYTDANGYFATPFIDISDKDISEQFVVRVKGAYVDLDTNSTGYARIMGYTTSDASGVKYGGGGSPYVASNGWNSTYDASTGVYTFTANSSYSTDIKYLRLVLFEQNGATVENVSDVVITVNEEIA